MAIQFSSQVEKDILNITAIGKDDDLQDVINYGLKIIAASMETGCRKILCDETGLEYSLDTIDNFLAAKYISENTPDVAKVAIVCNPQFAADAEFWETVAVNRGLQVRFFKQIADGREWLKKK